MKKAIDVFNEWARDGKDVGMESGHSAAVYEMIDFAMKEKLQIGERFSFLDLGCGNGWVPRAVMKNNLCKYAVGIDGAEEMIIKARSHGGDIEFIHKNLEDYNPEIKFDLIHSMEVLYYLADPLIILKKVKNNWLADGGRFIVGLDHYYENEASHSWQKKIGTSMLMLQEAEWLGLFRDSGFQNIESWRANSSKDWKGTLVITGKK